MKQRKKIRRIRIDVLLTEDRYEKLMKICGDYKTITEGIAQSIDWQYGKLFPNQLIKEQGSAQSFLTQKNDNTLTEEQERQEFEKLKEARRLRKAGDSNE